MPGAGSSDLVFRAFRHWLARDSRVLILDPTYGEYAHVFKNVIGCHVDRFPLSRERNFQPDLGRLKAALQLGYDLVALVNPNSPTGQLIKRTDFEPLLSQTPINTRVWIDETYIEYAGTEESVERFAAQSENILVCKSMSKVYALSGARAAYLCAGSHQLEALRSITPPWAVSLPAQIAAVKALGDPRYYQFQYRETSRLREQLAEGLRPLKWEIIEGVANFILCFLPEWRSSRSRPGVRSM